MVTIPREGKLVLFFCLVPLAAGFGIPKFLEFGACANLKVDPDLSLERYSGIWFNVENVPNEYTQINACSMTNYTWDGEMMTVVERGLNDEGRKVKQSSLMRRNEEGVKELTVHADGVPEAPYTIVATDYDNYACVHSCMSFMGFRAAFSWIFTRRPNPDPTYVTLCRDLMADHGIDPNAMQPVRQGQDCPYWERLETLLEYSERVQTEAKTRTSDTQQQQQEEEELVELKARVEEEEKRLSEIEARLESEERQLLHTITVEKQQVEEEVQDLREEVIHERRKHRRMEEMVRADSAAPSTDACSITKPSVTSFLPTLSLLYLTHLLRGN